MPKQSKPDPPQVEIELCKNVCTVKPTQQAACNLSPSNTQHQQISNNVNVSTIANNNSNMKNYYDKMLIIQAASTSATAATESSF